MMRVLGVIAGAIAQAILVTIAIFVIGQVGEPIPVETMAHMTVGAWIAVLVYLGRDLAYLI